MTTLKEKEEWYVEHHCTRCSQRTKLEGYKYFPSFLVRDAVQQLKEQILHRVVISIEGEKNLHQLIDEVFGKWN